MRDVHRLSAASTLRAPTSAMSASWNAVIRPRGAPCVRVARVVSPSSTKRAQGMPGAGRPHGPPAKKMQAAGTTGSAETSRHSPRDGWAAYTSSPRGPAVLPPSRTDHHPRPLGLSTGRPGPYDFAGASGSFVRTIARAAIQCTHRIPHPRLVTIAKRPSWRDGMRIVNHAFLKNESRIFSVGGLDKGDVLEAVSKIRFWAHRIRGLLVGRARLAPGPHESREAYPLKPSRPTSLAAAGRSEKGGFR